VFRFTLSGLLFQINLKHLLSISFLYFSGTTQALATYVNIGTIKDLIIKNFPKIVKFLFVPLALNEIEIFGSFSGLIMNKDKTEGLWIGKHKHCKDKVRGIKLTDKPVKTLGIYFGHNKEECEKLNWENKIEKMNNLLLLWTKRNPTILGKILKTFQLTN
jgi:hypothetical protein